MKSTSALAIFVRMVLAHCMYLPRKQEDVVMDETVDVVGPSQPFQHGPKDWILCTSVGELNLPPVAEEIPHEFQIYRQNIKDEYAWIRDKDWPSVTDSRILDYLKAENDYAEQFFADLNTETNIFTIYNNSMGDEVYAPYEIRDDWLYYRKDVEGEQYTIYCRKSKNEGAPEEVILDVNKIAEGQTYTNISGVSVSPDDNYVAYAVDHAGNEAYVIKIYDLKANSHLPDVISGVPPCLVWHEKVLGFFYISTDKVLFHYLNSDVASDKKVLYYTPGNDVFLNKSSSGKYIFVTVYNFITNEIYGLDVNTYNEDFPVFWIKKKYDGILYDVTHAGDKFYVRTNLNAGNYRVIAAPKEEPWNWNETYIPECEDYLRGITATEKYLIMKYKRDGLPIIKLKRFEDGRIKTVAFPDASYNAFCYVTNYESNDIHIFYTSLNRLDTTYKYDYDSDKLTVISSFPTIPSFNVEDYALEYIKVPSIKSHDEDEIVQIPVTIFYKKSLFHGDGTNPAYLHGYGAYGYECVPKYTSKVMSLISAGFVYVMAHVRGGDELGGKWHESGKLLNKKRTFEDFVAVAESLIYKKYTKAGNIVACGRSAGGMLIGAVLNERPELFKAAVLQVPYLDVLNTLLDESLPLTKSDFLEFGNPIQNFKYFNYIKSYSPYENIKQQNYPSIFVTTALSDMRVGYWEATKWVARLRKLKTDDNVVILKISMDSGHLSQDGRMDYANETACELAFIYKIFELEAEY